MKLNIIMHESFESAGAIEEWAVKKGHLIHYTRVFAGEKLASNADGFDLLIVMGGPQSPATTKAECPYFDAMAEKTLIKQAIDAGKVVLGVCLGAQLIGDALGASFEHSPHKEIGIFDLHLTHAAKNDPVFSTFPKTFSVAHWHADMPGLTKEAEILAYSEGCPRQIIRYTPKVYGFQCHFEFTKNAIEQMLEHGGDEVKRGGQYVQNENVLRQYDYDEMNGKLFSFLDYLQNLG